MSRKSIIPDKPIRGNKPKYLCYAEAWTRINQAIEADFPFEAIAILESIMFDRISSYLNRIGSKPKQKGFESFANLIVRWGKNHSEPVACTGYADLRDDIDRWRETRNEAIHDIVKPPANAGSERIDDFLTQALQTAKDGKKLANALQNWDKKKTRELNKVEKDKSV